MEILYLVWALILLHSVEVKLSPIDLFEETASSVNTKKLQKREISKRKLIEEFIEEKLVQQSQALEHIIKIVTKNEEMTEKLVENLSKTAEEPKLPHKVEFTRRSFNDKNNKQIATEKKINTWCSIGLLCTDSHDPVCAYDEKFGYGKFEDICHMVRVNCYWKYDFSLVPNCKPYV